VLFVVEGLDDLMRFRGLVASPHNDVAPVFFLDVPVIPFRFIVGCFPLTSLFLKQLPFSEADGQLTSGGKAKPESTDINVQWSQLKLPSNQQTAIAAADHLMIRPS